MTFDYTADQVQLRKAVREFAEGEIAPHVMEWDEAQTFPLEVVRKLGKLGYMGAIFPEELGGAGLGYIEYAILIEELSRVDGSVGIIVAAHTSLCSNHIYKMGSEEQRRKYIPKLASGEWLGCWSLTEPEAGSDAAGTRTKAVRDGDEWVLNGCAKTFTSPMRTTPTFVSPWPSPTPPPRSMASRPSSSIMVRPDSALERKRTSSAFAPAPPAR